MDRQRKSKMSKARVEMGKNAVRICPSVFAEDGVKCTYGERCFAEHSKEEYWAKKEPDLGFFKLIDLIKIFLFKELTALFLSNKGNADFHWLVRLHGLTLTQKL